jgi:hypothetical protein
VEHRPPAEVDSRLDIQEIPALYGSQNFITVFRGSRISNFLWIRWVKYTTCTTFLQVQCEATILPTPIADIWNLQFPLFLWQVTTYYCGMAKIVVPTPYPRFARPLVGCLRLLIHILEVTFVLAGMSEQLKYYSLSDGFVTFYIACRTTELARKYLSLCKNRISYFLTERFSRTGRYINCVFHMENKKKIV